MATALAAAAGCVLMALVANRPFAITSLHGRERVHRIHRFSQACSHSKPHIRKGEVRSAALTRSARCSTIVGENSLYHNLFSHTVITSDNAIRDSDQTNFGGHQLPGSRLIGSWLALHHNQKHHADNGKHSECLLLPIPYFRLPHQKPFAPNIQECH